MVLNPDFNYIPPTEEDLAMLNAFRNDKEGKIKAEEVHREAVQNYLRILQIDGLMKMKQMRY